jgi:hypothetical protein
MSGVSYPNFLNDFLSGTLSVCPAFPYNNAQVSWNSESGLKAVAALAQTGKEARMTLPLWTPPLPAGFLFIFFIPFSRFYEMHILTEFQEIMLPIDAIFPSETIWKRRKRRWHGSRSPVPHRIGRASAVSRSRMVVRQFFNRDLLNHPRELLRRVSRLRLLTPALRRDFFGA